MAKPTLMQGSKGPDVKILQAALNALPTEYAMLIVDGMFGPKTGARVREAQAALGIVIDGVVGPVTWSRIDDALMSIGIPGVIPGSKPPQFSFEFSKNDRPGGGLWKPEKAWDLFTLKAAIERHNRSSLSTEIILSIFFEESQFCNRRQITDSGKDGPASGFGQMETGNPDKQEYYAWAGLPVDPPGTSKAQRGEQVAARILANNEEAVRIHVGYYNWLKEVRGFDRMGTLAAQVGSHTVYIPLFVKGGDLIRDAWVSRNRKVMIDALNYAPANSPKQNSVPWPRFSKFWRFIIPDYTMAWVPPGWGTSP